MASAPAICPRSTKPCSAVSMGARLKWGTGAGAGGGASAGALGAAPLHAVRPRVAARIAIAELLFVRSLSFIGTSPHDTRLRAPGEAQLERAATAARAGRPPRCSVLLGSSAILRWQVIDCARAVDRRRC